MTQLEPIVTKFKKNLGSGHINLSQSNEVGREVFNESHTSEQSAHFH